MEQGENMSFTIGSTEPTPRLPVQAGDVRERKVYRSLYQSSNTSTSDNRVHDFSVIKGEDVS